MTAETQLEELRKTIQGVNAPFSSSGTFVPEKPLTLVFADKFRFTVTRAQRKNEQVATLQPLIDRCKPAMFGDKRQTRLDRKVRDALQLKAEGGDFTVEHFDPESSGILESIRLQMLPNESGQITAELYAVNVYESGGHFAPHKDTPRGQDMFGTLVVCLPSQFSRGEFVLTHCGMVQRYDWGEQISKQKVENQLHWVAFFGDVDHQIEKVLNGARVTVTYLLRRNKPLEPAFTDQDDRIPSTIVEAWRDLLADDKFLPKGGVVGYPCCHLYHQDARFQVKQTALDMSSASVLKGRDQLVAAASLKAGLDVQIVPYVFENCIRETWQLDHFPTSKEESKMRSQMDLSDLQNALPIHGESSEKEGDFGVTWLEDPPSASRTNRLQNPNSESSSVRPAAGHLHSCEYCEWGYFGNEASFVEFYVYAALHVCIPKVGVGPRAKTRPPKPVRAKKTAAGKKEEPANKKKSQTAKKSSAAKSKKSGEGK